MHKPHPISILDDTIQFFGRQLRDVSTYWVWIFFYLAFHSVGQMLLWGSLCFIGTGFVQAVVRYRGRQYRVDEAIDVAYGTLKRYQKHMAFSAIHESFIEQPWFFKLVGVYRVTLTSVDGANDIVLWAVPSQIVDAIALPPSLHRPVMHYSHSQLLIDGLCSNRLWAYLGALGVAYLKARELQPELDEVLLQMVDGAHLSLLRFTLSIAVLVAVAALVSAFQTLFTRWHCKVYHAADGIQIREGLFKTHQHMIEFKGLQYLSVHQSLTDRLFGRFRVGFHQRQRRLMLPSCDATSVRSMLKYPLPSFEMPSRWMGGHWSSMVGVLVGAVLPLCLLSVASFAVGQREFGGFFGALAVLLSVWVYQRWCVSKYHIDATLLSIMQGGIGRTVYLLPINAIQCVDWSQSFWERRFAVGTLTIQLADRSLRLRGIDVVDSILMRHRTRTEATDWGASFTDAGYGADDKDVC